MQNVAFVLIRRLRFPLILVVVVYATSILGFVLIPGQDDQGNVWKMDFFHAFYFVSFMGSTIGFGEIPYAFTDAQRYWVTLTIYATVISWIYSIGVVLAVFQEPAFKRLVARSAFIRQVRSIKEPFYLVCGYGATGSRVVRELTQRDFFVVVVEMSRDQVDNLEIDDLPIPVPALCADAAEPDVLNDAGLQSSNCVGVLALTNDDHTNLTVSITSKLLAPSRPVISRVETQATAANLASFGTDHIIDPFETFGEHLSLSIHNPQHEELRDWLINPKHITTNPTYFHSKGLWVICGFGRCGKAIYRRFMDVPVEVRVIEVDPQKTLAPPGTVMGLGTEADTLLEADIKNAIGIVAGTADDINNLSIIMTALELNPNLITVARQNRPHNGPLFAAANINMVMEPANIIGNTIFALINTPLLNEFLQLIPQQNEHLVAELLYEIRQAVGGQRLTTWTVKIDEQNASALAKLVGEQAQDNVSGVGKTPMINLNVLLRNPQMRDQILGALPLCLKRRGVFQFTPDRYTKLELRDEILFCGTYQSKKLMGWGLFNPNILDYLLTGREGPSGYLWRRFAKDV